MEGSNLLKESLDIKGFSLYSINLNDKVLKDKRAMGVVQHQWFDKGALKLVVRTGIKKDIIISDSDNKNYKRLLLNSIRNKQIPFYVDKKELENSNSSIGAYGFMYSLREKELSKIGNEGMCFGLWPKGLKSHNLRLKTVIECSFLYSKKNGIFFLGKNNVEYFLPKSASLEYYSRYIEQKKYYLIMKTLKLLINLSIINLESMSFEILLGLSKNEQKILLKRLMVLDWLLVTKVNTIIQLLDNNSKGWRSNFYYLSVYLKEFSKLLKNGQKILLALINLKLSDKEKSLLLYRLKEVEIEELSSSKELTFAITVGRLNRSFDSLDLSKKYFVAFMNEIFYKELENKLIGSVDKVQVSKKNNEIRLHLVNVIEHYFKKSVVSRRSLRKLHKKIGNLTGVKGVKGLLSRLVDKSDKSLYMLIPGVKNFTKKRFFTKKLVNKKINNKVINNNKNLKVKAVYKNLIER